MTGQSSFTAATDIYLVKTDANGAALWSKSYGSLSYDRSECVRQTSDGGYIVLGYGTLCSSCPMDIILIKTNATGDTLWTRSFGGVNEDLGMSLQQTSDGGYVIAGWTETFGAGSYCGNPRVISDSGTI